VQEQQEKALEAMKNESVRKLHAILKKTQELPDAMAA
jgi:hypothetical protein